MTTELAIPNMRTGWKEQKSYGLIENGKEVMGHDGQKTTIDLVLCITEQMRTNWRGPSSKSFSKDLRPDTIKKKVLDVVVERVKHLPKTDTFGQCDPFVMIKFGTHEKKTKVVKGVLDAEYGDVFQFDLDDSGGKVTNDIVVQVLFHLAVNLIDLNTCRIATGLCDN